MLITKLSVRIAEIITAVDPKIAEINKVKVFLIAGDNLAKLSLKSTLRVMKYMVASIEGAHQAKVNATTAKNARIPLTSPRIKLAKMNPAAAVAPDIASKAPTTAAMTINEIATLGTTVVA